MLGSIINHGSYLGIILVLVLTGSGLPIPEEVPIIAAGVASSLGTLNPWAAFAACLVGALAGDAVIYAIGYHFGQNLFRHPRFVHWLRADREARYEKIIRQHQWKVLFLARFMVGIRAPVYLAAGILRMRFYRFVLIDVFCATAVVGLFFGMSYAFGEPITRWIRRSEVGLTLVVVAVIVAAIVFFWARKRQRALLRQNAESGSDDSPDRARRDTSDVHHVF